MQQFDASMHFDLYGTIILQAALGFIASYRTFSVAPPHVIGSNVILTMVAPHFGAAVYHTLIARDDTLDRIITPRSDQLSYGLPLKAAKRRRIVSSAML